MLTMLLMMLVNASEFKETKRQAQGILVPLFTFSLIGLACFVVFCLVRQLFPDVYFPRRILRRGGPPETGKGLLSWIPVVWWTSEQFLINSVGLDGIMLLRFLKMGSVMFSVMSLLGLSVLAPVNFYANPKPLEHLNGWYELEAVLLPALSVDNVPNQSSFLRVHLAFTWLFSVLAFGFLISYYKGFVTLKLQYDEHALRQTKMSKIEMRSVMVFGIPPHLRNEVDLASYFDGLGVGKVENVVIFRRWSALRRAVAGRATSLMNLERVYMDVARRLSRGATLFDRFKSLFFKVNSEVQESLEHEGLLSHEESNNCSDPGVSEIMSRLATLSKDQRPSHRTGFLGLFGPRVDSARLYLHDFIEQDQKVSRLRRTADVSNPTPVGVVTFESPTTAAIVSQAVIHRQPFTLLIRSAPEPRDMYWPNLSARLAHNYTKFMRSMFVVGCMFLLVFSSTAIVTTISGLIDLNQLGIWIPFLGTILKDLPDTTIQFIQGVIPTALLSGWISCLPSILLFMSQLQGLEAESWIELSLLSKYFFYQLWNVVFITVFARTLLYEILPNPQKVIELLGQMIPRSATTLINYVILQAAAVCPAQLLLPGPLILTWLTRVSPISKSTPRQVSNAYYPSILNRINYGIAYPVSILVFVVGITYAPIAPVVLPFCAFYFGMSYMVYKYLLLYVHLPRYESKGVAAPMVVNRCLVGVAIMELTMMGLLALKSVDDRPFLLEKSVEESAVGPGGVTWSGYSFMVFGVAPLLMITFILYNWLSQGYQKQIQHIPLEVIGKVAREFTQEVVASPELMESHLEVKSDQELDLLTPRAPISRRRSSLMGPSMGPSRPSKRSSVQDGSQTPPESEFDPVIVVTSPSVQSTAVSVIEEDERSPFERESFLSHSTPSSSHLEPPSTRVPGILDAPIEAACAVIKQGDEVENLLQTEEEEEDDMQLHTYMHPVLIGLLPMAWYPHQTRNDTRTEQCRNQRLVWRRLVGQQQIGVRVASSVGEPTPTGISGVLDGLTNWTYVILS